MSKWGTRQLGTQTCSSLEAKFDELSPSTVAFWEFIGYGSIPQLGRYKKYIDNGTNIQQIQDEQTVR